MYRISHIISELLTVLLVTVATASATSASAATSFSTTAPTPAATPAPATVPASPTGLRVWNTGDFVRLYWYPSESEVLGYFIYRDGEPLNTERITETNYIDFSPVTAPVTYTVRAIDRFGRQSTPASVTVQPVAARTARAALSTYDKNNLIDDARFEDDSTMDVTKIQSFLEEHGSVLKSFSAEGRTAAEHIYDACREFHINPQAILATLQKEQGLIKSSSTPDPDIYAMGWYVGNESTKDFANQIYYGTKQFRRYLDTLANVNQTRYLDVDGTPWRVGQTHRVSDGHVTPANRATAGLYIYTPWIGSNTGIGGNYLFWYTWYISFQFDPGVPPDLPQPLSPGVADAPGPVVNTLKPVFTWTRVDGADKYALYIRNLATDQIVYNNKEISGALTSITLPSDILDDNTPYRWNMQSNKNGTWGSYSPRLHFQIDLSATSVAENHQPQQPTLEPPYPNPFNPVVTIPFNIPSAGPVTLTIYNSLGQHVQTLVEQTMPAGRHVIQWNAANTNIAETASGVYICRMHANGISRVRRLILVR